MTGCVPLCCGAGCCSYSADDCQDVQRLGFTSSGVYHVTPSGTYTGYDVFCDLDKNDGGGWLVRSVKYILTLFVITNIYL